MTTWDYTDEVVQVQMEIENIARAAMKGAITLEDLEEILQEVTNEEDQKLMLPAQQNINDCFISFTEITNGEEMGSLAEFGATFQELPSPEEIKDIYPVFHDVLEMMKKYHFIFAMIYSPLDQGGSTAFRYRGSCWPVSEDDMDRAQSNSWNLMVNLQERIDKETINAMRMVGMDDLADEYENNMDRTKVKIITDAEIAHR